LAVTVFSTMPMMSLSFMIRRSSPSIFRGCVAGLDVERGQLAAFVA
jgi:hypothetical protein